MVVVQPAGGSDKRIWKIGRFEKQGADGKILVLRRQVVVQVRALGGGIQCEKPAGVLIVDNGGKLYMLCYGGSGRFFGSGSGSGKLLTRGGHCT
jgi:hypothetical protein